MFVYNLQLLLDYEVRAPATGLRVYTGFLSFTCFVFSHFLICRDVDDIHDMMDDIQEQNEIAEEISGALSQPIGFAQELDEVSFQIGISREFNC